MYYHNYNLISIPSIIPQLMFNDKRISNSIELNIILITYTILVYTTLVSAEKRTKVTLCATMIHENNFTQMMTNIEQHWYDLHVLVPVVSCYCCFECFVDSYKLQQSI